MGILKTALSLKFWANRMRLNRIVILTTWLCNELQENQFQGNNEVTGLTVCSQISLICSMSTLAGVQKMENTH